MRFGARNRALSPRGHLFAQSAMHIVNDGLFTGIYPLLPLMAVDLGLQYADIGLIKTAFSGASAVFQVPAGIAAERVGEQLLLSVGTGSVGLGLMLAGLSASYWLLLLLLGLAGLGGNVQHPVATAVISRVFDGNRRATAIGTLNFSGDLGKVAAPLLVGAVLAVADWRAALIVLGGVGLVFSLLYLFAVPEPARASDEPPPAADRAASAPPTGPGWGIREPVGFALLIAIGMLDAAARGTALTFLPFVLGGKGFDAASMSLMFAILFGAGAAGKFLCGPLADRYGATVTIVVTELVTAAALLGVLGAPAALAIVAMLPLGFVLNGTSSVLYASVAGFLDIRRRSRGYGVYYTATLTASAVSPIVYGWLADATSLPFTFAVLAIVTGAIAPLAILAARRTPATANAQE
jgi:MFS family permease